MNPLWRTRLPFLSALFRLLSTLLFINSCDFKKSQDFEIVKILKLKLRNLLQLLYYKTIKILALTLGKWGSPPSHINTTVHNEHLTLWHETMEPVRLTRLPHPILGPIHFLSLARAPRQPLLSIIV